MTLDSTVHNAEPTRDISEAWEEAKEQGYYPVPYHGTVKNLFFQDNTTGGSQEPRYAPIRPDDCYMGFRLPDGCVGIDVDEHDDKHGAYGLMKFQADNGLPDLPKTWRITSRGAEDPGKILFQTSDDVTFLTAIPGADVDIISVGVPGTLHHKTLTVIECFGPDGKPSELPHVLSLPFLPVEWEVALTRAPLDLAAGDVEVPEPDGYDCPAARAWLEGTTRLTANGWEVKPGADFGQVRGERATKAVVYLKSMARHGHHVGQVIEDARAAHDVLDQTIAQRWDALDGHATDSADCCKVRTRELTDLATSATAPTDNLRTTTDSPQSHAEPVSRLLDTWADGPDPEPPTLLDSGNGPIVRPATLGTIYAEEKQGKTWAAMAWAVLEASRGRRVLYIDYENGERRFRKRIKAVAHVSSTYAPDSEAAARMTTLEDRIKYMPDPEGWISDEELTGYDLIIIDAAIDFVDNHTDTARNVDSMNSAQAVNKAYRRLQRVARETGACVVLIDHSNADGKTSGNRRKRGVADWQAKAEKHASDGYTVIAWEFDRDDESDVLPAVFLIFDGYRLQSYAPRPAEAPSLDAWAKQNTVTTDQIARYRQIVMEVGRDPGETRAEYRRRGGYQARDIDALITLGILMLDGDNRVQRNPTMPGEWRYWWETARADT